MSFLKGACSCTDGRFRHRGSRPWHDYLVREGIEYWVCRRGLIMYNRTSSAFGGCSFRYVVSLRRVHVAG